MKNNALYRIHQKRDDLLKYLKPLQPHLLREALAQIYSAELAEIFRMLGPGDDLNTLLTILENEQIQPVLRFLRTDKNLRLMVMRSLPPPRRTALLDTMPPAAVFDLVDGFNETETAEIISFLNPVAAREIEQMNAAAAVGPGRVVTRDYLEVTDTLAIADVLGMLRGMQHREGRPHEVYIVDTRGMLAGVVDLHELLLEKDTARPVSSVMKECPVRISSDSNSAAASRTTLYYGVGSAPVVDEKNHLIGVVTSGAAFRYLEKEYEDRVNGIMGFPLVGGYIEKESSARMMKRSLRLLSMLLSATGGGVVLALLMAAMKPPAHMLRILPIFPLVIGAARLYYRHTALLLEGRNLGKVWTATFKPRYIRNGAYVGLLYAIPLGGVAFLLNPNILFAAAAAASLASAVLLGLILSLGAFALSTRYTVSRSFLLSPAVLPVCDMFAVVVTYILFWFALH